MANKSDDSQGEDSNQPTLSAQERMAEVKRTLDTKAGGDSSEYVDDKKSGDGQPNPNEEEDDAKGGAGDANQGDDKGTGDDDSNDDSNTGDDDDDNGGKGDDSNKQESKVRFTQFKGDGNPDTYLKNLEDGYLNSSQEAIRIKDEKDGFERQVNAIKEAAARDPEFGDKLLSLLKQGGQQPPVGSDSKSSQDKGGDSGVSQASDNPFLKDAETKWNAENDKSAKEFTDANPEILTDPKLNSEVKRLMRVFANDVFESEGRLMLAGEAMEKAYRYLGRDVDKKQTQDLVDGMKKNAAPTRPQASSKKASTGNGGKDTKQFSGLTLDIASKMGISKDRLAKGSKR